MEKSDSLNSSKEILTCDECQSLYYAGSSQMKSICPNCSHMLYGFDNCSHSFNDGRCIRCYWDGSESKFVDDTNNALNIIGCNEDDAKLIETSYQAIGSTGNLTIVYDENELQSIRNSITSKISIPANSSLNIQNLFKITLVNRQFYIAQCLLDFGYPESAKRVQSWVHKYHFQLIGYGQLNVDLGKTFIRPETKIDKTIGRFFDSDIDLFDAEVFNERFYLVSSKRNEVEKVFDKKFLDTVAKYKNLIINIYGREMFISFPNEIKPEQSGIVEDVFTNCSILSTASK